MVSVARLEILAHQDYKVEMVLMVAEDLEDQKETKEI